MLRFAHLSNALYFVISGAFILIAMLLIVAALWNAADSVMNRGDPVDALLNAVGLIVIAMAAVDVGKYLFDEEVVRERELRSAVEARQSLTISRSGSPQPRSARRTIAVSAAPGNARAGGGSVPVQPGNSSLS